VGAAAGGGGVEITCTASGLHHSGVKRPAPPTRSTRTLPACESNMQKQQQRQQESMGVTANMSGPPSPMLFPPSPYREDPYEFLDTLVDGFGESTPQSKKHRKVGGAEALAAGVEPGGPEAAAGQSAAMAGLTGGVGGVGRLPLQNPWSVRRQPSRHLAPGG
jgi:hypothetical protein